MDKLEAFVGNHKRLVGLVAAGAATYLAGKTLSTAACLIRRFLFSGYNLIERYGIGSYAAISACTDGIGKGFALQLAKQGFNLVMFVRNAEKAQALADEIKETINQKIDIRIVQIDFSNIYAPGVVAEAVKQVQDVDISLLVNNVGMTFVQGKLSMENLTDQDLLQIITMNIVSQVFLTQKLLPKLRSRGKKSGIINLSSVTATVPMPGFVMYGATKLFNDLFSKSIGEEYKGIIDVLSIKPGWVDTPMVSSIKKKPLVITPEECAGVALKLLGRYQSEHGHFKHMIAAYLQQQNIKAINKNLFNIVERERESKI